MITVVVPISPDRVGQRLDNCVASVRAQRRVGVAIIVVCLWRATAGVGKVVEPLQKLSDDYDARIIYWRNPSRLWGPALSRNVGFRRADGDILASLDADAVLHPGTLLHVQQAIWNERRTVVRAPTRMKNSGPSASVFRPGFAVRTFNKAMRSGKVAPGPGSLIAAPREAVYGIKGWDEFFVGYGATDWDFVRRLEQWGCRSRTTVQLARIYALHQAHERTSAQKVPEKVLKRNRERYELTCSGTLSPKRNKKKWGGLRP